MRFLRVFAQQGLLTNWFEKEPPLAKVLKCFDINRGAHTIEPVSVFAVRSEREEVETVAAWFQISPSTPEKRFGVIVDENDCHAAGIQIDRREKGNTGINLVDGRHCNLKGTQKEFGSLISEIAKKMWEGEQRLHIYPAQQIAGQLGVFAKLPKGEIHGDSRSNCLEAMDKVSWHIFKDEERCVEIQGKLQDQVSYPIIAVRGTEPFKLWHKVWKMIWR